MDYVRCSELRICGKTWQVYEKSNPSFRTVEYWYLDLENRGHD